MKFRKALRKLRFANRVATHLYNLRFSELCRRVYKKRKACERLLSNLRRNIITETTKHWKALTDEWIA